MYRIVPIREFGRLSEFQDCDITIFRFTPVPCISPLTNLQNHKQDRKESVESNFVPSSALSVFYIPNIPHSSLFESHAIRGLFYVCFSFGTRPFRLRFCVFPVRFSMPFSGTTSFDLSVTFGPFNAGDKTKGRSPFPEFTIGKRR